MPLPLYGSGLRTARTSAAVCPTICLSVPFTTTTVGCGTSNEMPARGLTTTECENPAVSSIGFLPIRLIQRLPDETDDLAADAPLLGGALRDESGRRGQDRRAHPAEDARQAVLAGVDAAARLGDPLQVGDDPLAAPA